MIRINLLAGERRAVKATAPAMPIGQKVSIAGSVLVVVTLLGIGWRYWALGQSEAQLSADLVVARLEETRLKEVLSQVADFDTRRGQLQQRVALIDELRHGQSAPVHIIDQISRSLPEMAWLTSVTQDGYDITVEGRCTSLSALSDFVANLESTRFFKRPVEIVSSESASGQKEGPELIEFTVKGSFHMAGLEQPEAAVRPGKKSSTKGGKVG